MTRFSSRRGSVLILVIWIVAVLSLMVLSFAYESRQQVGIDLYVRERNSVNRILDSGRMLGESVLLGYESAKEPEIKNNLPDWTEIFEEDRWCVPKYELKQSGRCVIGPICLEEPEEDGADPVTVKIELARGTAKTGKGGIDINSFNETDDGEYIVRFQTILLQSGITEETEVEVEEADRSGTEKHNLMNLLISSWKDWRDEDAIVSAGVLTDSAYNPREDDGAEYEWYKTRYEEDEIQGIDARYPALKDGQHCGGPIKKIEELSYIRGFRDFPSVLYGGYLYDGTALEKEMKKERGTETNPRISGILSRFKVGGGKKLMITDDSAEMKRDLSTIPGLFPDDPEDESAAADCQELIEAICGALTQPPEDDDQAVEINGYYPFKNFNDLQQRIEDYGCDLVLKPSVGEYLAFPSESASAASKKSNSTKSSKSSSTSSGEEYTMIITGESMGMKYVVNAKCLIVDRKIHYLEWNEDK